LGWSFTTRETVERDTPANCAMSSNLRFDKFPAEWKDTF
jgi:hypothetical protein